MTPAERIAAIRAREQAATPGPWEIKQWTDQTGEVESYLSIDWSDEEDQDFIANARADIPWLLDRLARAEELLGRYVAGDVDNWRIDAETAAFLASDTTTEGSDNGK